MADKLQELLSRARERIQKTSQAELKSRLKKKWDARQAEAERTAQDYARRLAERARFRKLLSDDELDGMRFRWYQKHFCQGESLDSFRAWIDSRMAAEVQKRAQAS